jgi:hypothetical protein
LAYLLPSGQTAETAFAWVPNGSTDLLSEYLDHNSSSAPSHISFGVSLWLANDPPEIYASKIRPAIELLVKRFPDAKISVRSSASTVQAIVIITSYLPHTQMLTFQHFTRRNVLIESEDKGIGWRTTMPHYSNVRL